MKDLLDRYDRLIKEGRIVDASGLRAVIQEYIESLEKDAARYQWLRNESDLAAGWHGGIALAGFAKTDKHKSELDATIDTAMQANKE